MPNYYEILGCDKNASYEQLKKCYHDQVKKYHPDKSTNESRQEYLLLDKAWRTLRDPDERREYDLSIAKTELDEMPLYCELDLSEMDVETETGTYSFTCRCGGVYMLGKCQMYDCEKVKVSCDECTFHIVINLKK